MYMIVEDFNCHLGYLRYQEENENRKIVNKFIEDSRLILMNIDEKCTVYKWERGESKSAQDFVLANEKNVWKMYEDEDR